MEKTFRRSYYWQSDDLKSLIGLYESISTTSDINKELCEFIKYKILFLLIPALDTDSLNTGLDPQNNDSFGKLKNYFFKRIS